jgi:tRNA modification GTPase
MSSNPEPFPDGEVPGARVIEITTKIDLVPPSQNFCCPHCISVRTGEGLIALIERLTTEAEALAGTCEGITMTRVRHRQGIECCLQALNRFLNGDLARPELRAEDLRQAATALGRVTGRVDVEDILDHIFAGFCIGK